MHIIQYLEHIQSSISITEGELDEEEEFFLIDALSYDDQNVWSLASLILSQGSQSTILNVLDELPDLSLEVRMLWASLLFQMPFYQPYDYLLQELRTATHPPYIEVLITCLEQTTYFVLPLVFLQLSVDDRTYRDRLKQLLKRMGFAKFKKHLILFPELPHEAILRDVFGDELIDSLSKK